MLAALHIARKEVAQRIRDRSFFIVGLAAPLILAFIFNLVLGGLIEGDSNPTFEFGLVKLDQDPVAESFASALAALDGQGVISLTTFDSVEAARAAADDGAVDAVFLLPLGLSTAMISGASIEVVGNVDAGTGTAVATAIAVRFVKGVRTVMLGVQAALGAGAIQPDGMADAITTVTEGAAAGALPVTTEVTELRSRQLGAATFFIAGLGIFFVFFIVGLSVTSLLDERSNGTLARLLAAPISPASIVAGKTVASIGLGIVTMAILAVTATLIMGADFGNPLAAGAVIIAAIIAAAGIMTLVGGFARTAEQAGALQSIVALTLAMLGGTFVPITTGEGLLASLRYLTPNAWFMRGLGDVAGGAYGEALRAVLILLAIGAVTGAIGLALVRRVVKP